MALVKYIIYFGHALLFINVLLFTVNYRKHSIALKIFALYLGVILVIQLITSYKGYYKINNIYLSHYYFIGQFILLSLFFKSILQNQLIKKLVLVVLIIVLSVLIIHYIVYPLSYYLFNLFEIILTSIPLLIYSFLFFVQTIDNANKKLIYIVSGFFLYILCSTLLFSAGNIEKDTKNIIWWTNSILYLIYQFLIFIEWYKHFRKPYKLPAQKDV